MKNRLSMTQEINFPLNKHPMSVGTVSSSQWQLTTPTCAARLCKLHRQIAPLEPARFKNICLGMHYSVNWPFFTFVYWGGTSENNKAKINLSQQFHTAHCLLDRTVWSWCNKPTFMQCSAKASKLYSVKLLAGKWVSSNSSWCTLWKNVFVQSSSIHIQLHIIAIPLKLHSRTNSQHSPQILLPTRHTNFPTEKSLISQMTCTILQKITRFAQENKESEGLAALTQKWAPWLSPANLCTPARIPCWLFVVLCLLLGALEQPCLDLQWTQQTGDQSETWRSFHIPECVFATASPTKRNRSQVLLSKTMTKGNWQFVIHKLSHI